MTPLAMHIAKQALVPAAARTVEDSAGMGDRIGDLHCFECTEVMALARELKMHIPVHGVDVRSTFLPAPRTWLEWQTQYGHRYAVLLEQSDEGTVSVSGMAGKPGRVSVDGFDAGTWRMGTLDLSYPPMADDLPDEFKDRRLRLAALTETDEEILALLAIINTPRIIGRRQHQPHKGFERKLRRAWILYPLNAWNEIKLEVQRPKDMQDSGDHSAMLTGGKALHFCRSFIRIKCGRLEIVRSHWRGDAANGVKFSRYKVTA